MLNRPAELVSLHFTHTSLTMCMKIAVDGGEMKRPWFSFK